MVRLDNSKQQVANSGELSSSNSRYQIANIDLLSLGIKCAQLVQSLWMKMCTTAVSAQPYTPAHVLLCTNSVQSPIHQQLLHRVFDNVSIYKNSRLCTVSTEPTITTKSEYIKRQEEPIKEIS